MPTYFSSGVRTLLAAALTVLSLFNSQPAQAQATTESAACQAVTADWSGGRTLSTATAIPLQSNNDYKEYGGFEEGETITWSVSASGTLGSNNYSNYWVAELISTDWEYYKGTKDSGPFTDGGSRVLGEGEALALEVIVNYQSPELPPTEVTMSVTCTAPAAVEAPVANAVTASVTYESLNNPITLSMSGGAATSVEVASSPAHGSAIASATAITYTPAAGYYGPDSFTYTATNDGGQSAPATVNINVLPPAPAISAVNPSEGPVAGGTSITITGTGVGAASTATIDGLQATIVEAPDLNTVRVTTPSSSVGAKNVVVTTPAGTATLVRGFTYVADVGLSVAPSTGPLPGGEVGQPYSQIFTASGGDGDYNFVLSGDHPPGLSLSRSGTLSGTPLVSYNFNFTVIATDGSGKEGRTSYTLNVDPATPSISSIAPSSGLPSGGNAVTITGTNFSGVENVYFGTVAASSYVVNSTTSITATAPAQSAGIVNVSVTTPGGTASLTNAYTYSAASADATLSNIWVGAGTLTPAFSPDTTEYTVTVAAELTQIWMNADTNDADAWYIAGGSERKSGSSWRENLSLGANQVQVVGLAEDRVTRKTYTVTIVRGEEVPGTTTSVVVTPNPSVPGESVQVTATVSAVAPATGTPTGSVTFSGAGISQTVSLDGSGKATLTSTDAVTGTLTATYNGVTGFSGSGNSIEVIVGRAETSTNLVASPATSALGQEVELTATVTAVAPSTKTPVGSILFTGPGGLVQSVALDASGMARLKSSTLQTGTYVATYSGSPTSNGSLGTADLTVGGAATTTTVSATPNPSVAGESVELTATVTAVAPATGTATGTVTFTDPDGLSLTAPLNGSGIATVSTTKLKSGTVTASYNGDVNFGGSSGTVNVTVAAAAAFTFSPAGGPLSEAMAAEEYSQKITASGGTGSLIYSVASGALPDGMVLNVSTGELTGPTSADSEGDYNFTIEVRDGDGATGTATYTLKVQPREVTVTDKVINVPAGGTPANVYLNRGATGGPFTSADLTFVEPSNAGTATLIQGELAQAGPVASPVGWYLQFTPNPAFSGQARVGFRLTSVLGISNAGTVTYNLGYDAAQVAEDIDALVHGFVRARQNLIASTIKVPGLLERRKMASSQEAVTTRVSPSADGMTLGFSTSLAQIEGARDTADGITDVALSPFNIWIDGTFMAHNREENGNKWGSFAAVSLGADYLLSDKALLGLSFHYDHMTDPTDEDAELTGNGWLAGPYASFEIGTGVFWDASILYGGSSNDIDTAFWDGSFDTTRWLFDTSINGQWYLDEITVVTPKLRAVYFSEEVDDYAVRNNPGDSLEIDGFTEEQLRVSLGAEISRQFTLENDTIMTPKFGGSLGYSGIDGDGVFGSVTAGVNLQTADGWNVEAGLLFNIEGDGQVAAGGKVGVNRQF